jgi:NADPH2:quinone reductase
LPCPPAETALGATVFGIHRPFRARVRRRILKLAQDGELVVPMAETFKFDDAPAAFAALTSPHSPGKLALVNER